MLPSRSSVSCPISGANSVFRVLCSLRNLEMTSDIELCAYKGQSSCLNDYLLDQKTLPDEKSPFLTLSLKGGSF